MSNERNSVIRLVNQERLMGNDFVKKMDFENALRHYQKGVQLLRDGKISVMNVLEAKLFSNISLCHLKLGNFDQSIKSSESVIEKNPKWFKGYFRKLEALIRKSESEISPNALPSLEYIPECHSVLSDLLSIRKELLLSPNVIDQLIFYLKKTKYYFSKSFLNPLSLSYPDHVIVIDPDGCGHLKRLEEFFNTLHFLSHTESSGTEPLYFQRMRSSLYRGKGISVVLVNTERVYEIGDDPLVLDGHGSSFPLRVEIVGVSKQVKIRKITHGSFKNGMFGMSRSEMTFRNISFEHDIRYDRRRMEVCFSINVAWNSTLCFEDCDITSTKVPLVQVNYNSVLSFKGCYIHDCSAVCLFKENTKVLVENCVITNIFWNAFEQKGDVRGCLFELKGTKISRTTYCVLGSRAFEENRFVIENCEIFGNVTSKSRKKAIIHPLNFCGGTFLIENSKFHSEVTGYYFRNTTGVVKNCEFVGICDRKIYNQGFHIMDEAFIRFDGCTFRSFEGSPIFINGHHERPVEFTRTKFIGIKSPFQVSLFMGKEPVRKEPQQMFRTFIARKRADAKIGENKHSEDYLKMIKDSVNHPKRFTRVSGFKEFVERQKHKTPSASELRKDRRKWRAQRKKGGSPMTKDIIGVYCSFCTLIETNVKFKKCGRCRTEYYCSQKCQKKAWKSHKKYCTVMKVRKEAEEEKEGNRNNTN